MLVFYSCFTYLILRIIRALFRVAIFWAWTLHIAAMNVVHRDIACRNIFISSIENSETQKFFIAKIGDFGMARKVDGTRFLISEAPEQLPWRQCAPEVLSLPSKFSEFSDVWSFGILLWEAYSWGEQVFKEKTLAEMIEYYTRDFRFCQEEHGLKKPDFMPEEVEKVMDDCLRINFALSRGFKSLKIVISQMILKIFLCKGSIS